jgi:hypothetical protein
MSEFPYAFDGRVSLLDFGRFSYSVIFLPDDVAEVLPLKENPRLRVRGEVDDYSFHGAWMPSRGGWYLKLSQELLKKGSYAEGSWVYVRFRITGQDEVDVPEALEAALQGNSRALRVWEKQSPGKQRGLAYRVASAKTAATAAKRAGEVISELLGTKAEPPRRRKERVQSW